MDTLVKKWRKTPMALPSGRKEQMKIMELFRIRRVLNIKNEKIGSVMRAKCPHNGKDQLMIKKE